MVVARTFREAEPDLIDQAKMGDYAAFEAIVDLYEQRIYSTAMRIVRDKQDAEDTTQKTFLSLIEHLKDFRGEAPLGVWLMRVAANHALKSLRKRHGLELVPLRSETDQDSTEDLPPPTFVAPWLKSPEQLAATEEMLTVTHKALESLPDTLRTVFILRDIEEFSTEETADILGIKPGTVKVRLLRARLKLREYLTEIFGDRKWALEPHVLSAKTVKRGDT